MPTSPRPTAAAVGALLTLGVLAFGGVPGAAAVEAPTVAAATARPSVPGSLLFVRDHDVWIARTDGSGARALTTDGSWEHPYLSPSQADDGTIVAAHDERIVVMRPSGRVVRRLDPPPLENSAGHDMDGTPSDVAISPDGSLIAYTQVSEGCFPGVDCDTRFATAYTPVDRVVDPATYGTTFGDAPSWIGNGRTVQGGGQIARVELHDLGGAFQHWFKDSDISNPARDLTDPTVSRDGRWVATIRGWGATTSVLWSRVVGRIDSGTPSVPAPQCETNEEPVASPTFSADSTVIAWALPSRGIMVDSLVTAQPDGCNQPTLLVAGAEQPSFSAAPYSVPAPENTARPTLGGTAKVGRTLRAGRGSWTPAPSSFAYAWLRDGRPIRGASGSRYRLTAKDARHAISVQVTVRGPGGTARATSVAKRVAR